VAVEIRMDRVDAVIFDLDGVITDTASVHAAAWKRMFDGFLADRPERGEEDHRPFSADDYYLYVDGKPRYDGVESFLALARHLAPAG
jgi:alpha,alpha-trehalase